MKTIIVPPSEINNNTIRRFMNDVATAINERLGNIPDDSTASNVAEVVEDLNALMEVLR